MHKVQYVVEIVGPRSLPSAAAKALLDPKWQGPLGDPQTFVMGPADARWRPLVASDPTGSYDSLALTWNLLKHHGALGAASARHLLAVAQTFAEQVQRRAIPLPIPDDIDAMRETLETIRDTLDIGVAAAVAFPAPGTEEAELAEALAELGLQPIPDGYAWLVSGWDAPLLYASACEDEPDFPSGNPTLRHHALSLGFSIPLNPAPAAALDAMLLLADELSRRFGGVASVDGAPLEPGSMRSQLDQALQAFERAHLEPGSPEARLLFEG
ncbi:MAG: hypothetical protein H6534_06745 [Chthonomonadaceae bacterium]|nr:hypothetical protein [Chthonomonadaceae bacterium]